MNDDVITPDDVQAYVDEMCDEALRLFAGDPEGCDEGPLPKVTDTHRYYGCSVLWAGLNDIAHRLTEWETVPAKGAPALAREMRQSIMDATKMASALERGRVGRQIALAIREELYLLQSLLSNDQVAGDCVSPQSATRRAHDLCWQKLKRLAARVFAYSDTYFPKHKPLNLESQRVASSSIPDEYQTEPMSKVDVARALGYSTCNAEDDAGRQKVNREMLTGALRSIPATERTWRFDRRQVRV